MPSWVDLSEHQVSLNVYNTPEGKRLILRPQAPQSSIPPAVIEMGFEPRGNTYERRDLQFSLPQLRKYFPKAFSREFAISEIYFRPEEPAASDAIERYQWQRNRAGGQEFGNRQEIRSLTEALFNEHVKPLLRPGYAETLAAYQAKQSTTTHCSLVQVAGAGEWRLERVGSLDECRPRPANPAWVKKVDDFFSPAATEFGASADDEARPQYRDGRSIPIEGDEVVDVRGGFGGNPVYLTGKVITRRGALRIEITGSTGFLGNTASTNTEPLSDGWTVKGEEHPYDRQLRIAREREEQWQKENEAREADLRARAESSKAEGYPHLDMIAPPAGSRIEDMDSGRTGTIIEYVELNDVQEPVVLFDDQPAGSSGVTIGNQAQRYRYRVIATAPVEAVEETAIVADEPPPPPARAPWHVPKAQFIAESHCKTNENGNVMVVFDDILFKPNLGENWTTKKAKEEVHARLVKDALHGRTLEPFPASLPTFEVMLDYPTLVYQLNQRAEKNVSRLLAQLGVAGKLLDGEDGYLKVENPPYIDLVIERLPGPNGGDRLYLTHYLRMNGDSVLDAEMVFEIRKNGTLRLAETATQNPIRGGELRGRDVSFANMFSKNLLDQGFGAGKVLWPRDERADELKEQQDEDAEDLGSPSFAVGQPVRFARGLYEGSEGTIESISESGWIVVRGTRGAGFGATPKEAIEWGLHVLEKQAEDIDPTSPDGYAAVMADEALQLKFQDTLDAFFAERIVAVRNALRDLGWQDDDAPAILKKSIDGVHASATIDTRHVGAGRNVVGIVGKVYTLQSGKIQSFADDLTGSATQLAGQLDEAALKVRQTLDVAGKVKVYGESALAAAAGAFTEALNAEFALEDQQSAVDPAFQGKPLSDALKLTARDNDSLEVRNSENDNGHVVTISRLSSGQFKALQGSAESIPATLLTAVRWADNRLTELLAADRRAKDNAERAHREMVEQRREIRCFADGFLQFISAGLSLDRTALMKAIQLFTCDGAESTTKHTMNLPRFLSSGVVSSFTLPEGSTLELAGENTLRISVAGYTCEIHGSEPAPEFSEDRPWIRANYERNAPMSFVGALSSACAWLKENQAWEAKKASYPDGGHQVEMLARQYAAFLHEAMPTHHDGAARDMHRCFAVAIMDKEVDYLMAWIARGRGQNELSKKFFTKATGCKLPNTIRDITAAIYAWAGFTPEQAATREAEKEAAHEARMATKRIDDEIRWSGDALSNTRVNHEGEIKTTKQFLDEILDQGYTDLRKYKCGAVDRYALANPEIQRSYQIKGRMVDYAKAVLAKRAAAAKPDVAEEDVPEAEPQHSLRP